MTLNVETILPLELMIVITRDIVWKLFVNYETL